VTGYASTAWLKRRRRTLLDSAPGLAPIVVPVGAHSASTFIARPDVQREQLTRRTSLAVRPRTPSSAQ
jgi:hypothetical protein